MKIVHKYSHLNGEEYLIVHHKKLYSEIKQYVRGVNADDFKSKLSHEKRSKGLLFYSPIEINTALKKAFSTGDWRESRYQYYITLKRGLMEKSINLPFSEQKDFLIENGEKNPILSYNQTDFVKEQVAVEVQFGKYAFVAYDLFVKHMLFYSGGLINLGIEILPTKNMQKQMSSGIAFYEGEVYKIMRQGRNNPAVPLLILGVEP